jgi:hypothetical protein
MAFSGAGAGTIGDPYQVVTITHVQEASASGNGVYFKQMNDINFAPGITAGTGFYCPSFGGQYDGNHKQILNLRVGMAYAFGFELISGSSVKDLTFRITNSVNNNEMDKERIVFGKAGGTLNNVSLTDIKIITSGTGQLLFLSNATFASTCTLRDIVLEGNIQQGFNASSVINCTIESVRMLKTYATPNDAWTPIPLVGNLGSTGVMKYCQVIALGLTCVDNGQSILVGYMFSGAKIQESFVYGFLTVNDPSLDTSMSHGFIAMYGGTISDASEVKDSYFKGKLTVNGGEQTSGASADLGKAGYAITAGRGLQINRCIVNADFDTPLNDNRTLFSNDIAGTRAANNFYKISTVQSITPVDSVGKQVGLSDQEWLDSASFDTFDFDTIWVMGADGPELRNNPVYAYETSLVSVGITEHVRINGTSFSLELSAQFTSDYGVDIYNGDTLIDSIANTLSNTITVPLTDVSYTLKPFYMNGVTKVYGTPVTHMHYAMNAAVAALISLPATSWSVLGSISTGANRVHGSLLYDGFIYGTTRNDVSYTDAMGLQGNRDHAKLVRIPEHDITNYELIDIKACVDADNLYGIGEFSKSLDQIVKCGDFLYSTFYSIRPAATEYLLQYDPALNSYKVFRLPVTISPGTAPLTSDGEYLYISDSGHKKVHKILASQFVGEFPQFNTVTPFDVVVAAVYDTTSQGGHILGGYADDLKGEVHSSCSDGKYIYVSFTTSHAVGDNGSGYFPSLGISACEVHKIRKSDMTPAGFANIPKSTDDMTQNGTHLFYGVEVQPGADVETLGYGWGAYAVRKSDMKLTGLPRLHSREFPPAVQSYGSFLLGEYLFDLRTDKSLYVLDISDVDNWDPDESIGKRTLAGYIVTNLGDLTGTVPNEILKAPDNTFYEFQWALPSGIVEFVGPALVFDIVPVVQTLDAIIV